MNIDKLTLDELRDLSNMVRARFNDLQAEKSAKENRSLIGKCFVYQNSYSSSPSWPLYAKIIGINEDDGALVAKQFETDSFGKAMIEDRAHFVLGGSWKPITARQYAAAWKKLLRRLEKEGASK